MQAPHAVQLLCPRVLNKHQAVSCVLLLQPTAYQAKLGQRLNIAFTLDGLGSSCTSNSAIVASVQIVAAASCPKNGTAAVTKEAVGWKGCNQGVYRHVLQVPVSKKVGCYSVKVVLKDKSEWQAPLKVTARV